MRRDATLASLRAISSRISLVWLVHVAPVPNPLPWLTKNAVELARSTPHQVAAPPERAVQHPRSDVLLLKNRSFLF
jgi:hypothetical protein